MDIDYSALRARWEHAVVSNPRIAFRAGPPSWIVRDEWKEGKESFHDANERVKARYFNPDGSPKLSTLKEMSTLNVHPEPDVHPEMSTVDYPGVDIIILTCECGKPRAPHKSKCWACIKKVSRSK